MGFFDKLTKSKGGYIFLSHSHDDIEKVRLIRNSLEQEGFEPLCFYLKCLNDDSEIEDLIKREIDAREWFVFVDSENARNSKWVNLEREYIKRTDSKKIITVDINDPEAVHAAIHNITHNLRVFISCSAKDYMLAQKITRKLEEKDFLVFWPPESVTGFDWAASVVNAIKEASQEGCVLVLVTPQSLGSREMFKEIALATRHKGNIIPVMVGNVKLNDRLMYHLCPYHFYYLSENPTDREIENMIDQIGQAVINK